MKKMMKLLLAVGIATSGLAISVAHAGVNYPDKSVRVVVPFPPGVTTDVVARAVADGLSKELGQTFFVENKSGADGVIGTNDVIRAKPDGYTLLVATNGPLSAVVHLTQKPPYNVQTDLTPISDLGRITFGLYVSERLPVKTVDEFISYTKANPGKLNYASGNLTGQMSLAHITMKAGLDMAHIPYKGETNAMHDVVGGRVEAIVATLGTGLPLVETGKLRLLAVIAPERSPLVPDVPTMAEVGFAEFPIQSWFGLLGPANMPKEVVETLNAAANKVLSQPELIAQFSAINTTASPSTIKGAADILKQQLDSHGAIIKEAGITLD